EEADWRMIEKIDRVAQLDEVVLLLGPLARDVADRPCRPARVRPGLLQRSHPEAQPACLRAVADTRHPHFALQRAALARCLGELVDRLGDLRIDDEHTLD